MNKLKKISFSVITIVLIALAIILLGGLKNTKILAKNNKDYKIEAFYADGATIKIPNSSGEYIQPWSNIFCVQEGTQLKGTVDSPTTHTLHYYNSYTLSTNLLEVKVI